MSHLQLAFFSLVDGDAVLDRVQKFVSEMQSDGLGKEFALLIDGNRWEL